MTDDSFPRQQARTRRFTLGVPRALRISPDGERITFLRTKSGDDPVTCLWEADAATGAERLVADPRNAGGDEESLPAEERARRERVRETAGGIVSYATDAGHTLAVFALSGQVYAVPLGTATPENTATPDDAAVPDGSTAAAPRLVPTPRPALDPRPDPTGRRVAYVHGGTLRVTDLASGADAAVSPEPEGPGVTYGLPDFIAAEEMHRNRGYWWSPDGTRLLLARVDDSPVMRWHIADPANPRREPAVVAYPAAGTPNADVSLLTATLTAPASPDPRDGAAVSTVLKSTVLKAVDWDRAAFPYLVTAAFGASMLIVVQSRDQKTMAIIDGETGETLRTDTDQHWVEVVSGVPAQFGDGRIAWTQTSEDTRRLVIAAPGELGAAGPVTPPGLQVRAVLSIDGDAVYFTASRTPAEIGVWRYSTAAGLEEVATAPGVHTAVARGGTTVVTSSDLGAKHGSVHVNPDNGHGGARIASRAHQPNVPPPSPRFLEAGPGGIRTAVLFPSWHEPGHRLPVLMDPYGGPHAQRVLATASAFWASQWLAEQGFAVVVADGRGTPGRGPAWERAVAGDLATPVLTDQVTALRAAADAFGDLDDSRVGIRGWSFGGFLAALAVLRRPDVFHAGIAGAPVTDWRLYDTHYTERYLGDPAAEPAAYQVSSLNDDPERTRGRPWRPLLLIHGMADDNVVVAHSLRLSSLLLAAGYPHSVLPLSGVTHMTPQEVVAENLLLLQVDFLRRALGGQPVQREDNTPGGAL